MSKDKFAGGEEVSSNWFKFNEVGDGIKGTLKSKTFQKAANATFPDQYIYQINNEDDNLDWNVGISVKKVGTIGRLNKCQEGEIIAIVFESEGDSAIKGGYPAKNLKVLTYGMDPLHGITDEGTTIDEIVM